MVGWHSNPLDGPRRVYPVHESTLVERESLSSLRIHDEFAHLMYHLPTARIIFAGHISLPSSPVDIINLTFFLRLRQLKGPWVNAATPVPVRVMHQSINQSCIYRKLIRWSCIEETRHIPEAGMRRIRRSIVCAVNWRINAIATPDSTFPSTPFVSYNCTRSMARTRCTKRSKPRKNRCLWLIRSVLQLLALFHLSHIPTRLTEKHLHFALHHVHHTCPPAMARI